MTITMNKTFVFLLLLLATFTACKFDPKDGLNWDQNLVAPILKSRVGLADALTDSSVVQTNDDNSLTVVFRDTLVDLALADYLQVPDTHFAAQITLNSITLATDTLVRDITLGELLLQLCNQGNALACTLYYDYGGQPAPFSIPPMNVASGTEVAIDASQFFDEAVLINGWMDVVIENHLIMDIDSVSFILRNDSIYQDTLIAKTMGPIPVHATLQESSNLAGKRVESHMAAILENIAIDGIPFGTILDLNSYLRLMIIVRDLKASSATAVFPAQTVIDDYSRINYQFDNGMLITKLRTKSGLLHIEAISTIKDTIAFEYTLPTAIKNGQPVRVSDRLEPSPFGPATANIDFDLIDYYIDMTLNGDSVNLFPYKLVGKLLYSGNKNTMDLTDSIDLDYGLYNIIPNYIEGYLGRSTFNFKDTIQLDFFRSILGGTLDLADPKVTMTISNSIGVDGELNIRQMDAINTRTQQTVGLTGSLMSRPTEVRGPRLPNVGQTIVTPIVLSPNNSNIRPFISLLPDRIEFDMDVWVNKNGNPAQLDNFATDQSRIAAFLDIEVPLHGITDHLTLQDTVAINLSQTTIPKGVESGNLKLVASNQFPFDADVQVYFTDFSGVVFDSLFTKAAHLAAGIMDVNGYVTVPTTSEWVAFFDQPKFTRLKQRGQQAIVRFSLSTKPNGTPVKLYTTYGIDFHVVGDFGLHVGT
jgi:hypothetical protein